MKLCFGDIVVVNQDQIGVVVKSWAGTSGNNYDVYVRLDNKISNFKESDVERYKVRHKYLSEEELEWQSSAVNS
jgi:hypothetical protein